MNMRAHRPTGAELRCAARSVPDRREPRSGIARHGRNARREPAHAARVPVPDGFPAPGQVLVYTGVRQIGDAGENIGEPGPRVDVVELRGDDEGVHRRGSLTAAVGAGEQPRPSSPSNSA